MRQMPESQWNAGPVAQPAEQRPHKPTVSGSIPDRPTKPAIDDLRAICAGNMPTVDYVETGLVEDNRPCCMECDKRMMAKMYKGIAVAWACSDPGCPMYGLERR